MINTLDPVPAPIGRIPPMRFGRNLLRGIVIAIALCLAAQRGQLWGQDQAPAAESEIWEGTLDLGPAKLRLEFHLDRDSAGKWTGKMVSIDQGNGVVPLDEVTRKDRKVEWTIDRLEFSYQGTLADDNDSIQGTMTQFGRQYRLELQRGKSLGELTHIETWQGTMTAGPQTFEFQLRLLQAADGTRVGRLDSLSEHLADLSLRLYVDGDDFRFELPVTQAKYSGKLNAAKEKIEGEWLQSGQPFPLTFTKVDLSKTKAVEPPQRPQTPKPPYPYEEKQVEFAGGAEGVRLAGTLTIPRNGGPFAAAILISGSGPQDRDETLLGHKPFLVLADHLTRAGFAVLRYDDRGAGKSSGTFGTATSQDFARDATAAFEFLQQQPGIDPERVGFIGHSEGGLVGPMVAAERSDVGFVIMMAGPGVTGREIIENQTELISRAEKLPDDKIANELEALREILDIVGNGKSDEENQPLLQQMIDRQWDKLSEAEQKATTKEMLMGQISALKSPWIKYFLEYDPRPTLARVQCPTLAVNGELDLQVDPKLNLPAIRQAFESAGKSNFEIVELEKLNHLFQTATTGSPTEYRAIDETIAPVALQTITDYLQRVCRPSSGG